MPTTSLDAPAFDRADVGREIERVASTSAKYLDDLIGNSRWFTTLIVAEIAGLSKFGETAAGWKFGLAISAVLVLSLSVVLFVLAIQLAQSIKNHMQTASTTMLMDVAVLDLTDAKQRDWTNLKSALKMFLDASGQDTAQDYRSRLGLWLFLVGSFIAGAALFIS